MELLVLDKNYDATFMVDEYKSIVWAVRFNEAGDFELYLPASKKNIDNLKENSYLWYRDSDRLMIIDTITVETDSQTGPMLMLSGQSLESILRRRVVGSYTRLSGNLQNAIKKLLDQNVISPMVNVRKIPNFTFKESTDSRITSLTLDETYFYGETVYEVIVSICQEKKIGWKVIPSDTGGFEFSLFIGEDRSYGQNTNPYVVFSPNFENLLDSRYVKTYENYRNSVLSIGTYQAEITVTDYDDQGNAIGTHTEYNEQTVTSWATNLKNEPSGLERRETFVDNSDLTGGEKGGTPIQWRDVANSKGKEFLTDYEITTAFDGEINSNFQYIYGEDFFLGDIVQVANEFGMESKSYISEIVFSNDENGKRMIPTFTSTEEEKDIV